MIMIGRVDILGPSGVAPQGAQQFLRDCLPTSVELVVGKHLRADSRQRVGGDNQHVPLDGDP